MSQEEIIRFDPEKRSNTVEHLPEELIKKFIIIENRDSRGRVSFHIAFKKTKRSSPDRFVIPKEYKVFDNLIEAELAIFEMVELHIKQGEDSEFEFMYPEETLIKNIILLLRSLSPFKRNK